MRDNRELSESKKEQANAFYRVGDLNEDVYFFWSELQQNSGNLIKGIQKIKKECINGAELFRSLVDYDTDKTPLWRATRFFVLNRISFSGTTDSGGYSEQAFRNRFTQSAIERLKEIPKLIKNVEINFGSYEKLLFLS